MSQCCDVLWQNRWVLKGLWIMRVLFVSERRPPRAQLLSTLQQVLVEKGWRDVQVIVSKFDDMPVRQPSQPFDLVVVDVMRDMSIVAARVRTIVEYEPSVSVLGFIGDDKMSHQLMPSQLGLDRCLMLSSDNVEKRPDPYRAYFNRHVWSPEANVTPERDPVLAFA